MFVWLKISEKKIYLHNWEFEDCSKKVCSSDSIDNFKCANGKNGENSLSC